MAGIDAEISDSVEFRQFFEIKLKMLYYFHGKISLLFNAFCGDDVCSFFSPSKPSCAQPLQEE